MLAQMNRVLCASVIWLLSLLGFWGEPLKGVCPRELSTAQEKEDAAQHWTRENYNAALDLLFPDLCATPTDARWVACVRILPAHPDEPESSLFLEKHSGRVTVARLTRPKGKSVHAQLTEKKQEHPNASLRDLTRLVELESRSGDQKTIPDLLRLADQFEKLRFSPVPSDEIMMDATQYRFRVRSSSGDHIELVLQGFRSASPHHPLGPVDWAESARQVLAAASPPQSASPRHFSPAKEQP